MNRDSIDFAHEPVRKVFGRMFFPILIGMVSMVVLNITDGAFVGHGVGSDALAAVNIVAPMFMISSGIGLLFGIGSSVVSSIHLAKGNVHAANLNITQGAIASFVIGVMLGSLVLTFQRETCLLFGCSEALIPLACSYLKWVAVVTPFNMFGCTAMFAVRLDGHPRFAMAINCGMAIANIFLDWLLIYPMQMGLEGAAIATCTAFGFGNIPLYWFLQTQTRQLHLCRIKLSHTSLSLSLRNLGYQAKIGLSALLGELAIAAVLIVGNYVFINYLGEDGVAAFSVACYCLPIVFMIGNAVTQSIQPVISFAYGVHNLQRMREALRIALTVATLCGILGTLVMSFGARFISGIFLPSDCEAYRICCEGLPYYSSSFLFISLNVAMIGYLQSIEAATSATIFTILRGFIFSIPAFIVLPAVIGTPGLWFATPLAETLTLLIIMCHHFLSYLILSKPSPKTP